MTGPGVSSGSCMSEPPSGALAGESFPRENESEDKRETQIEEIMASMKERGKPYTSMSEYELMQKAEELYEKQQCDSE